MPYVQTTLILVMFGIWGLNIELLLVVSLNDMSLQFLWSLYDLAWMVMIGCWYVAKHIDAANRQDSSAPSPST